MENTFQNKLNVLVVEDNDLNARFAEAILKKLDFKDVQEWNLNHRNVPQIVQTKPEILCRGRRKCANTPFIFHDFN